ncbi:glycosyltransferase [Methanobacterium sp. ACI-7]|uniref:glycosyltransferase n=1 Tax=unclassified Methanobacterium TaxID=2627676 RepID=UPI0039C389F1
MISVICIYNDKEILDNYLIKSLKKQNIGYELILIDNTKNRFNSAASALNYSSKNAKGKYLMFVHQDIDLLSDTWLREAQEILDSISNLGIAGVAGKLDTKKGIITNIKEGIPPKYTGKTSLNNLMKVQTLDECLFIIPRHIFEIIQFNEEICDDWHLYAVEYCLNVIKHGFFVYLMPLSLYHRSSGFSLSKKYYSCVEKILKKYKDDYKWIYTTIGDWNTRYPFFVQLLANKFLFKWAKLRIKLNFFILTFKIN